MSLRIGITGGAGFLGSHLTLCLELLGHQVVIIDRVHPRDAWRLEGLNPEYHWRSTEDGIIGIEPVDILINAAAVTDVNFASRSPSYSMQTGLRGTLALLEAMKAGWCRQFVQISTHSVYGKPIVAPNGVTCPFTEGSLLRPSNFYGAIKAAQEMMALTYHHQWGLDTTVLRMCLMYGERERSGALVSTFIKLAREGRTITLDGGGQQLRELNYVANAVFGICAVLDNFRCAGEVYNISSGEEISIRELAELAVATTGRGQLQDGPPRPGEEGRILVDHSKATRELGYKPHTMWDEGFRLTYDDIVRREARGA